MRSEIYKVVMSGALSLLAISALGQSDSSVTGIMNELNEVSPKPVAAAPAPAPVVVAEEPVAAVDSEALLAESRDAYVAGDYARAEKGFSAVEKAEPGNPVAAYYLAQLHQKIHRTAEDAALDQVDAGWNTGLMLDYYPLSAEAIQQMGFAEMNEPADVKSSFPEIKFPEGSSVTYRPNLQKLFVYSSPSAKKELIQTLDALNLAEVQRMAEQVEIETRFVEFTEGALAELGFNWSDTLDGDAMKVGGDWSVQDGENLFSDALRSVPFDRPQSLSGDLSAGAGSWNIARIEDLFSTQAGTLGIGGRVGGSAVDLLLQALDQTSGADVLSAPRVVTLSGVSALIKVGQEHSYPTVYEAGESQGTVLHVRYEDFEETLLGVEMKVTPVIKGDEINLTLNPRITELTSWEQFELAPADSSYTYYQYRIGQQFEHDAVVARLPVFKRRELKSEVNINDGATVGMGGMISQTTEAFNDKVPVLGSIPLVGRLFRSEGERTVKRNLMIFVTAKKVQPNGLMVAEKTFDTN